MKRISIAFIFFILLYLNTACTDTATSQKGPAEEKPPAANANIEQLKKSQIEYPAISSVLGQAEIKTLDDTTFRIDDKRGKVLLLNLWATWCGPCRYEMPELVRLQDEYRDRGFEVIGLNVDNETPEQINPFAQKMKLNYTLAWSTDAIQRELTKIGRFGGIPQSYLIDAEGRLRGVFLGAGPKAIKSMAETVDKVMNGMETS